MSLLAAFVPYGYGVDGDDNDADDTHNGQMLCCYLLPRCLLPVAAMEERHDDDVFFFVMRPIFA